MLEQLSYAKELSTFAQRLCIAEGAVQGDMEIGQFVYEYFCLRVCLEGVEGDVWRQGAPQNVGCLIRLSSIEWSLEFVRNLERFSDNPIVSELFLWLSEQEEQCSESLALTYEYFMGLYQGKTRRERGVFYSSRVLARSMITQIHENLIVDFGLEMGISSSQTWSQVGGDIGFSIPKGNEETPFLQILDPAVGTGIFVTELLDFIYVVCLTHWRKKNIDEESLGAVWKSYVLGTGIFEGVGLCERIHGFDVMKGAVDVTRIRVQHWFVSHPNHPILGTVRFSGLQCLDSLRSSEEYLDDGVGKKRGILWTVILGNPPYRGISENKGQWITNLVEDYKFIDGVHFEERKHWLQDDYVKFIRMAQWYIARSGVGIIAFVNPHGYIRNLTFRGMRWNLLRFCTSIRVLDLHGNVRNKNIGDENIFAIKQGISINIFVRNQEKTEVLGDECIQYSEIKGSRLEKEKRLRDQNFSWSQNICLPPFYFFDSQRVHAQSLWSVVLPITEVFSSCTSGMVTARDFLVVDISKEALIARMELFCELSRDDEDIRTQFFAHRREGKYLKGDTRGWSLSHARRAIHGRRHSDWIVSISYRPFDSRFVYYCPKMVDWGREKLLSSLQEEKNIGIVFKRGNIEHQAPPIFVVRGLVDFRSWSRPGMQGGDTVAPLFVLHEGVQSENIAAHVRSHFSEIVGECSAFEIVKYIYGLLHSKRYREAFVDILSVAVPPIPIPNSSDEFWNYVQTGSELISLHLMEGIVVPKDFCVWCGQEKNEVASIRFEDEKLYSGLSPLFCNVPDESWTCFIGGYRPLKKWFSARKGVLLSKKDREHVRKMAWVLMRTTALCL